MISFAHYLSLSCIIRVGNYVNFFLSVAGHMKFCIFSLVTCADSLEREKNYGFVSNTFLDLQSRIVVAENLPEDHCHQNLMKIFSAVGRQDIYVQNDFHWMIQLLCKPFQIQYQTFDIVDLCFFQCEDYSYLSTSTFWWCFFSIQIWKS